MVANFTLWQLYPEKEPWHHLNKRQGKSQSLTGHSGEQKKFFLLPEFEPWTIQPVV
jgi:hypothetical protein